MTQTKGPIKAITNIVMKIKRLTTKTTNLPANQGVILPHRIDLEGEYIAREPTQAIKADISLYDDIEHPIKTIRFLDIYI